MGQHSMNTFKQKPSIFCSGTPPPPRDPTPGYSYDAPASPLPVRPQQTTPPALYWGAKRRQETKLVIRRNTGDMLSGGDASKPSQV